MNTPSRREFVTYAAAATLASALPASGQNRRDITTLPLVVDLIGPIAVRWSGSNFELWMPDLKGIDSIPAHQAGIKTTAKSFELEKGDYELKGPQPAAVLPLQYSAGKATIYQGQKGVNSPVKNKFIYIKLPKPRCIVGLDRVSGRIYEKTQTPPNNSSTYASGVRLLYDQAGTPTLVGAKEEIELDPAQCEIQTNILICYLPYDTRDAHATESFREVSRLFGLNLEFEPENITDKATGKLITTVGPIKPCQGPVIGLP